MACQCSTGLLAPASSCATPLARRPLRLSVCARSKTSSSESSWSLGCNQHLLRPSSARTAFAIAHSQTGRRRRTILTQAYNQKPDVADRVVAAVPYLIPLCDGLRYGKWAVIQDFAEQGQQQHCSVACFAGKFFFAQFPAFARLLAPLNPLVSLYFTVPFAR